MFLHKILFTETNSSMFMRSLNTTIVNNFEQYLKQNLTASVHKTYLKFSGQSS